MFVHPPAVRQAALALIAAGLNDCEVARRLGVPRRTVRDWRIGGPAGTRGICPRCWRPTSMVLFDANDYAELLGLYLGDGHISPFPRTQRLRLMLDAKYPGIVNEAAELLDRVVLDCKVGRQQVHGGRMVTLWSYYSHWSCLLPQHGPGKKHDRRILLEPWQERQIAAAPWRFLTTSSTTHGTFLDLFVATCAAVGVECRVYTNHARIYRRASVEKLLEHVGRKT